MVSLVMYNLLCFICNQNLKGHVFGAYMSPFFMFHRHGGNIDFFFHFLLCFHPLHTSPLGANEIT